MKIKILMLSLLFAALEMQLKAMPEEMGNYSPNDKKKFEQIKEEDFKEYVKAAKTIAKSTAPKDDRMQVVNFYSTLNTADQMKLKSIGVQPRTDVSELTNIFDKSTLVKDPKFIKNTILIIDDDRIIGGGGPDKSFPDCVAVGSLDGFCCTGTLIAPRLVVTAGHCHPECTRRISVGDDVSSGSNKIYKVVKAVRNPSFTSYRDDDNYGVLANDVTLLILEKDVEGVTPRKIAPTNLIDQAKTVIIAGYGRTDSASTHGFGVRRKVGPVGIADASLPEHGADPKTELVVGKPMLDRDSCNGDSGGPIYIEDGWGYYLAGSTSRATKDSRRKCGDGGIYVRLDKYRDWIKQVAEENGIKFE